MDRYDQLAVRSACIRAASCIYCAVVRMTRAEIASQPAVWADARVSEIAARLPGRGECVGVIGCGTSLYVGQSYAAFRESAGYGITDAFPASLAPPRRWDVLLAVSRSGTTTEVCDAVRNAVVKRTVALTGVKDSPLVAEVDEALVASFADEQSIVQTRFATTALLALLASAAYSVDRPIHDALTKSVEPPPAAVDNRSHFVFLGAGWTYGIANEAALKLREMAGCWSESYPAMEYRHGPLAVSGPKTLVWGFGTIDQALIRDLSVTGAAIHWPECDPVASLLGVHRLGLRLAAANARDPDRPLHLSRSVVFDGTQ